VLPIEPLVALAEGMDDRRAPQGSAEPELLEQVRHCLARWDELVERDDRRTDPVMAAARVELAGFEPRARQLELDGLAQQLKHLILLFDSGASPAALRSWIKAVQATSAQQRLNSTSDSDQSIALSAAAPAAAPAPAPTPVETPEPSTALAASFNRAQLAAAARPAARAPDLALDDTQLALDPKARAVDPPTQALVPQVSLTQALVPQVSPPVAAPAVHLDPRLALAPVRADPETWAVSGDELAAALRAAAGAAEAVQRAQNGAEAKAGESNAGVGPAAAGRAPAASAPFQTSTALSPMGRPAAGNEPRAVARPETGNQPGVALPSPLPARATPAKAFERARGRGVDDFALDERRNPRVIPAPRAAAARVSSGPPRRPSRAEDRTFGFRVNRKTWWALLAVFAALALLCAVLFVSLLLGD
jgi:hypothetical protein